MKVLDDPADNEIRNQFINTEHVYNSDKVFEWSSNSVSMDEWDINGKSERVNLNVTTALRKMSAVREEKPIFLNVLVLTQDLNTLAEDTSPRLAYVDVESFLKQAVNKSEEIRLTTER